MNDDLLTNIKDNTVAGGLGQMLNNINNNNSDVTLSSQLVKQDSLSNILGSNSVGRSKTNSNNVESEFFIDSSDISNDAMKMYEREQDISKFTQLANSDPENTSQNEIMQKLFADGVVDPFEDDMVASLSNNKSLINDLEL